MRESATVVAIKEDGVWVETHRQGTCNACSANKGCGQGLMTRLLPGRAHYVWALTEAGEGECLAVGDRVEVSLPDDVLLKASAIVYLLPLGFFMVGMLSGASLVAGDLGAITGGLLGLAAGMLAVRCHAHWVRHDAGMHPRVVANSADLAPIAVIEPQRT